MKSSARYLPSITMVSKKADNKTISISRLPPASSTPKHRHSYHVESPYIDQSKETRGIRRTPFDKSIQRAN